ncbi:MAG: hypothetical protein P8K68_11885 [Algibacter sp.]|uniref:hypothetical protein n=1 Tax=Algibacter sp. TaxID=1872428 RepID=UPI002632DD74|nr:hypothetical protein [Algibacter sp.]MDG1730170.1 hypothetical protein [Algibacter sp.]MDG2179467.1 hypothetical protein [Algibacter sp.]
MNAKKIILLSGLIVLFLSLSSFKSQSELNTDLVIIEAQEGFVVYATYDGKVDAGYNFVATDRNGNAQTLTFQKANDKVLRTFDLSGESLVGTNFKITFNKDGKTDTITMLEKL